MEKKSYTFDEIKLKMANYCVYQDRCHYEVEQKMREFSLIEEAKEEIILFQENLLLEFIIKVLLILELIIKYLLVMEQQEFIALVD